MTGLARSGATSAEDGHDRGQDGAVGSPAGPWTRWTAQRERRGLRKREGGKDEVRGGGRPEVRGGMYVVRRGSRGAHDGKKRGLALQTGVGGRGRGQFTGRSVLNTLLVPETSSIPSPTRSLSRPQPGSIPSPTPNLQPGRVLVQLPFPSPARSSSLSPTGTRSPPLPQRVQSSSNFLVLNLKVARPTTVISVG